MPADPEDGMTSQRVVATSKDTGVEERAGDRAEYRVDDRTARARAAVGCRFRLHGRDPATGLDCVGLVAHACGFADVPTGYALRFDDCDEVERCFNEQGWAIAANGPKCLDCAEPGDVFVARCGPRQIHLGIVDTDHSLIHACAWLRRVVANPAPEEWRFFGLFRPEVFGSAVEATD